MAKFEVPVVRVRAVEKHPNADRLDIVRIGDYNCISNKKEDGSSRYAPGDLVVYVPEAAIVPEWMLRMGFWNEKTNMGLLAGPQGNRVKAVSLRGVISQGIMFPVAHGEPEYSHPKVFPLGNPDLDETEWAGVDEGDDMAGLLGIVKYEPEIPDVLKGAVASCFGWTIKGDLENVKKFPDVLQEGEEVVMTEKVHGVYMQIGYVPKLEFQINADESDGLYKDGDWFVTSKGLAESGMVFKLNQENVDNLYVKMFREMKERLEWLYRDMYEKWQEEQNRFYPEDEPFFLIGELYGPGVQDLHYSFKQDFVAHDIYRGQPGKGRFLDEDDFDYHVERARLDRAPVLYRGPFSKAVMLEHTKGASVLGNGKHIREGLVVKPVRNRRDDRIGRVILKSVSDEYLLRKGNATEYA
jgi:RNA ligase (TIGR02306 family)